MQKKWESFLYFWPSYSWCYPYKRNAEKEDGREEISWQTVANYLLLIALLTQLGPVQESGHFVNSGDGADGDDGADGADGGMRPFYLRPFYLPSLLPMGSR